MTEISDLVNKEKGADSSSNELIMDDRRLTASVNPGMPYVIAQGYDLFFGFIAGMMGCGYMAISFDEVEFYENDEKLIRYGPSQAFKSGVALSAPVMAALCWTQPNMAPLALMSAGTYLSGKVLKSLPDEGPNIEKQELIEQL